MRQSPPPPAQIQHPPHRLERVERGCADGFSAPRTRGNLSGKPQKWHTTKKGPNFLEYENLDVFLRYERQKILLKHKMHSDKMEDGPLIDGQEPRRRPPHPSALQHRGIPDGSLSGNGREGWAAWLAVGVQHRGGGIKRPPPAGGSAGTGRKRGWGHHRLG